MAKSWTFHLRQEWGITTLPVLLAAAMRLCGDNDMLVASIDTCVVGVDAVHPADKVDEPVEHSSDDVDQTVPAP